MINPELLPYAATVITGVAAVAAVTDLARNKIYNWLTIPALAGGVIYQTWMRGGDGLLDASLAVGLGLLCLGWMFLTGVMGAGDVKLLMAVGAWGGVAFVLKTALLSVLAGGVIALVLLAAKGRLKSFSLKIYGFLMSLFIREMDVQFPKADRKLTMPFGLAIAIAAVWEAWAEPFETLGLKLW